MAVKYFCDRCGKEAKELFSIVVYTSIDEPNLFRGGLCKKCHSEILKNVVKAIRG